jgi:threonine/homoserine/homoserine lactone efflux protein
MEPLVNGLIVGVALAAPVGPVGLLCIRLALTQGRWPAAAAGMGAATADAIFGAIAGLGLSLIRDAITAVEVELSLVGTAIIFALGAMTWRKPATLESEPLSKVTLARDFALTFSMAITNPATMFAAFGMFAALGAIDASVRPYAAGTLVAGVFAGSAAWWLFLASLVVALRQRIGDNIGWVNKISGAMLFAFGAAVLIGLYANGGGDQPLTLR